MFAAVMAAQGSSPSQSTTDLSNTTGNSPELSATLSNQPRLHIPGDLPATHSGKVIAAPHHEALETSSDSTNAGEFASAFIPDFLKSDTPQATEAPVPNTPDSSTNVIAINNKLLETPSVAPEKTEKTQLPQMPHAVDSGILLKQKVAVPLVQENDLPIAENSISTNGFDKQNADLDAADQGKIAQPIKNTNVSQEVIHPGKPGKISSEPTCIASPSADNKEQIVEPNLGNSVGKVKPSQLKASASTKASDDVANDVSEIKESTKKVAAPQTPNVTDVQMLQPGLPSVAVVPAKPTRADDAPIETKKIAAAAAAVAPVKETAMPAYQQLSGAASLASHAAKKEAAKNNIGFNAKDNTVAPDETSDESNDAAEIEAPAASSTRFNQAGQKVQNVSASSAAMANNAPSTLSAQGPQFAVPATSSKDSVGKVKVRSRDTGLSSAAPDQDPAKITGNSDGLQVVQPQMPVDTSAVPAHAVNAASGVSSVLYKEPGGFATASTGNVSRSIDSTPGASFTTAQNMRMEPAMPGGRQQVEVGFHDGTLGWLSVRATAATDGGLHLSMAGRTNETAAAVDRMMPSLQHFLQDHDVRAHSVSYARQEGTVVPVATSAMATSAFSANSSNTPQSDRGGAGMGQQRSHSGGGDSSELSQRGRNSQERAGPARISSRYEGLIQEQGLLSIRI